MILGEKLAYEISMMSTC